MPTISKKIFFWVLLITLQVLVLYIFLVVADFGLQRYLSYSEETKVSEAESIERKRVAEEDRPQRRMAISQGFKPLFYPETVDIYSPLRNLALRLGIAPLAPQPNSRLYFCNEGYGLITYSTDRFGFRNQEAAWDKNIDILLIGDSFTHGACVLEKDTIAGFLKAKTNVINLGSYGNHAIHNAAVEKIFIPALKPKKAVLIFHANDNDDGDLASVYYDQFFKKETHYFNTLDPIKLSLNPKLIQFYGEADSIINGLLNGESSPEEYLAKNNGNELLNKAKKYLYLPTIRKPIQNLFKSSNLNNKLPFSSKLAIDTLIELCKKNGCKPFIAYIPNSEFWRPDSRSPQYKKLLEIYSKELGIIFIDTSASLDLLGQTAYAIKGPHLSPNGNKAIAEQISKIITAQ
jgi:hypothetical protein